MVDDNYTIEKLDGNWTERKSFAIKKGRKVVLKLHDWDEAKEVLAYLNKIDPKKTKKSGNRGRKSSNDKVVNDEKKG